MNTQALNTLEEMASSTLIQEPNGVFSSSGHHFTQTTTRTAVKTVSGSESVYGVMLVGAFTAAVGSKAGQIRLELKCPSELFVTFHTVCGINFHAKTDVSTL